MSSTTNNFLKGLGLAILIPLLYAIQDSIRAGGLKFDWPVLGAIAAASAVAYLIKVFSPKLPEENKTT